MDFNELLIRLGQVISRRRRLFLLIFSVSLLAAVAGAYVKSQRFESSATIFVSLTSPRLNTSHVEERNNIATLQSEEFVASQIELMQTRDLIEELVDTVPAWVFESKPSSKWYIRIAVDLANTVSNAIDTFLVKLKLIEPENPRYEKILTIENGLNIFPVRKSQVIEISFVSKNPKIPKVVLDTFINIYKVRLAQLREKSEGAKIYLAQTEKLNEELEQAERALTNFMVEKGVVDIALEKLQILKRLDTLASLVKSSKASENRPDNTGLIVTGQNVPPQILQQSATLSKLLIERIRLAASYTNNQRDVLRLDAQIASIRTVLNEELKTLAYVMEQDRARLKNLLQFEPHYNWLSRQVRVLSASYETYSKAAKDRETFFDRDTQILAQIIDSPTIPFHPLKPSRLILVVIGFVFSVILAFIGILIIEWISQIRGIYAVQPQNSMNIPETSPIFPHSDTTHVSTVSKYAAETPNTPDSPVKPISSIGE